MKAFIESGAVFELILAVILVEALIVVALWRFRSVGVPPFNLLPDLGAAAAILVAARAQTMDAGWIAIGGALTLALVCHLTHLARVWR